MENQKENAVVDYNTFMDSLGNKTKELKNDEVTDNKKPFSSENALISNLKPEKSFDSKFRNKYGFIRYFFVTRKLNRYLKKVRKHHKLLNKYNALHSALSLAVASGYSNVQKYQNRIKAISEKASKINV